MIKTWKMMNFNGKAFRADVSGVCWEQMVTEPDEIEVLVSNWSNLFSLTI